MKRLGSNNVIVTPLLEQQEEQAEEKGLTVVGVLAPRATSAQTAEKLGIRDANMDVYVPLTTALRRYRDRAQVTRTDVERASREFDENNQNADQIAQGEKDQARQALVQAMRGYRGAYHRLRRITLYDFARDRRIAADLP